MSSNGVTQPPHYQVICKDLVFPPTRESIQIVQAPKNLLSEPLPKNHIRIKILYACLNYADALQCGGRYQEKVSAPFIPGKELAGIVCDVNGNNDRFKVGDSVILLADKDGWQSYMDLPILYPAIIKVPKSVDLKKAASLLVAYSTSHVALTHPRHGALTKQQVNNNNQKKSTVLVLGASGGVGLAAVQIAKSLGATVIAACSSDEKCKICLEKGNADFVVNYSNKDTLWFKKVLEFTKGKGCDIIYDPVGGNLALESLKCIAWGGSLIVIGFASSIQQIPANILLVKNVRATGCYWGSYMKHEPQVIQQSMATLFEMLIKKEIDPYVSECYPLDRTVDAMNDMLERRTVGRVLLSFVDEQQQQQFKPSKL